MSLAQAPPEAAKAAPDAPKSAPDETTSWLPAWDFSSLGSGNMNLWVSADYGISFFRGMNLPPLATTSPPTTARANAGVIGAPGTLTLFGGTQDDLLRSGFRLSGGLWLNSEQTFGIEAGFMMVESQSALFFGASNGSSILARPFSDAVTNLPQAVLVAFPGSSAGSVDIRAASGNLYGLNLDFVERIYDAGWLRLNGLFGYRYYGYNENLGMEQTIVPTSPLFLPGTRVVSGDSFRTRNMFNGVDLGFRTEYVFNSLSLELLARVALGNLQSGMNINGSQTTSTPGSSPVVTPGGVYALPSNIGAYAAHRLESMPEFGATLKWQVTSYLQLHLGYSFLMLNGVVRAPDVLDTAINTANFVPSTTPPSPNRPAFLFSRSDVWVQTISAGLVFSY